jgi:hypothetical protein
MGTFAETATVDYRLSFAGQGKQTSVSANKGKFAISVFPFAANYHFPLIPFFARV